MPELPEVETVRRQLKKVLLNKKILSVDVLYSNIIEYPSVLEFCNNIKGQTINDIDRYGKWLIIVLDDYYLLSHLRMEGKYFIRDKSDKIEKHEHIVFNLDNNKKLIYRDVRKFGKMHLIKKDDIKKQGPLIDLGLEPWDNKLSVNYLKDKLKNKRLPIKTVLLDQKIIVGIGNIYANEILFLCKINPLRNCNTLTNNELQLIIDNTKKVLELAIDKGGSTIKSYTSVDGVHGLFQQELNVHSRENLECKVCKTKITKITIGGRGTYYCSNCQK